MDKIHYWNRIFKAYILGKTSQLSFWHGDPEINSEFSPNSLGPYYMSFSKKAEYAANNDLNGIPLLDYQGKIGLQYNPIAIAQWGLGNYNLWFSSSLKLNYLNFIKSADWLVENLEINNCGFKVWMHHFDFEYRDLLVAPWYSGLAQGQGISVLVRAFKETGEDKYSNAAKDAIKVFSQSTSNGGVNYTDEKGNKWIEEYIVNPPTHILNGFIWGMWGIYDYKLQFKDSDTMTLFDEYKETLLNELDSYDNGFWSLYEHSGTKLKMITSLFYHKLHIVQLRIMHRLTDEEYFKQIANKWDGYLKNPLNRYRALFQKIIFKVLYY